MVRWARPTIEQVYRTMTTPTVEADIIIAGGESLWLTS